MPTSTFTKQLFFYTATLFALTCLFTGIAIGQITTIATGLQNINYATPVNSKLFFTNGDQLMCYDETTGNMVSLLTNTNNIAAKTKNGKFAVLNGFIYFTNDTNEQGVELWRSDGTIAGTQLIADLNPGTASASPTFITTVGSFIYFIADDGVHGTELWLTDGSASGTTLVEDISPSSEGSIFSELTAVGNYLYFIANSPSTPNNGGLWVTNGTLSGTEIIDLLPNYDASNGYPSFLTAAGDYLYFNFFWGGEDLYKLKAGTKYVEWVYSNNEAGTNALYYLTGIGNNIYFNRLTDQPDLKGLWRSDGTMAGTYRVGQQHAELKGNDLNIAGYLDILSFENDSYFSTAGTNFPGFDLHRTQATGDASILLKSGVMANSSIVSGGFVYFSGYDELSGVELWRTNGTATELIADIIPGVDGSQPAFLTNLTGNLYFFISSSEGTKLMKYASLAQPPSVASFSPASGLAGTTIVTITGNNFIDGNTTVKFNGTLAASVVVNSSTQITTTVPVGATTGKITVTTPDGTATSANNFIVIPVPAITSFTPTSGSVGERVVITGKGFTGVSTVAFNGTSAVFTLISDTEISTNVPSGTTTGPISITTPGGMATSNTAFTVIKLNLVIKSFSPTSGPRGTKVTISGAYFTGATAVKFDDAVATNFTVTSSKQIIATVPENASTGKISVTTPEGTAYSSMNFVVTTGRPIIESFSPTAFTPGFGTVTIKGYNFLGTTAVKFNGVDARNFIVVSSTQITATAPTNLTPGLIAVTTPIGTGISKQKYRVNNIYVRIAADTEEQGEVALYPNPVHDKVNIDLKGMSAIGVKTIVTDDLGKSVLINAHKVVGESLLEVDMRGLRSGLYIIQLRTHASFKVIKVVKQ